MSVPHGNQIHREPLNYSLPTDVATLHSMIKSLLELQATTTANTHLAACLAIARVQTEPTRTTTTTTTPNNNPTTSPLPSPHPSHSCMVACGRGAASPEVFKKTTETNWHGRLGRTHMVDVDALSDEKLAELDTFLLEKLNTTFSRGAVCHYSATTDSDKTFETLASVGLRLEDRGYYGKKQTYDGSAQIMPSLSGIAIYTAFCYAQEGIENYWRGFAMETVLELAKYRGLFDYKGYLKSV